MVRIKEEYSQVVVEAGITSLLRSAIFHVETLAATHAQYRKTREWPREESFG